LHFMLRGRLVLHSVSFELCGHRDTSPVRSVSTAFYHKSDVKAEALFGHTVLWTLLYILVRNLCFSPLFVIYVDTPETAPGVYATDKRKQVLSDMSVLCTWNAT